MVIRVIRGLREARLLQTPALKRNPRLGTGCSPRSLGWETQCPGAPECLRFRRSRLYKCRLQRTQHLPQVQRLQQLQWVEWLLQTQTQTQCQCQWGVRLLQTQQGACLLPKLRRQWLLPPPPPRRTITRSSTVQTQTHAPPASEHQPPPRATTNHTQ